MWAGWNQAEHPVYGKTGTAERAGQVEQAWYMCFIPDPKRPIVIAATVEQGGFGDEAAAPIARLIASKWFNKSLTSSPAQIQSSELIERSASLAQPNPPD